MFCRWYFFIKLSQKRLLFDIVDRKECFLDLRREILKAQKNGNFPQRLVHGFCPKFECFLIGIFLVKLYFPCVKSILSTQNIRKIRLLIFWIEKNVFKPEKSEILKKSEKSKFSAWFFLLGIF